MNGVRLESWDVALVLMALPWNGDLSWVHWRSMSLLRHYCENSTHSARSRGPLVDLRGNWGAPALC